MEYKIIIYLPIYFLILDKEYYDQTSYPNTTRKDDNHHNNHSYLDHREKNSSPIIKKSYTGWYKIFVSFYKIL